MTDRDGKCLKMACVYIQYKLCYDSHFHGKAYFVSLQILTTAKGMQRFCVVHKTT